MNDRSDVRDPAATEPGARAGTATLAELVRETLVERRRARRWRVGLRLFTLAWLSAALVWFASSRGGEDERGRALYGADAAGEGHTALVRIEGVIAADAPASLVPLSEALGAAFDDPDTRAVVLGVDSPGGSPVQSALVYDEIVRQRALHPDVPVHAVLGDVAASGGYFVASAADTIHANAASIVGSIGVRLDAFGAVDTLERLGIERRSLTSGEHKALLDPFAPVDPVARERLQDMIDGVHRQFIDAVVAGRGERLADDPELFSGLVWNGEEGLDNGLVDALGDVPGVARDVVGAARVVDFTREPDPFERLASRFGASVGTALGAALGAAATAATGATGAAAGTGVDAAAGLLHGSGGGPR